MQKNNNLCLVDYYLVFQPVWHGQRRFGKFFMDSIHHLKRNKQAFLQQRNNVPNTNFLPFCAMLHEISCD